MKNAGVYRKFEVRRTDGRDAPGGDRQDAEYFVLDVVHDKFAKAALLSYSYACRMEYPKLAEDMVRRYNLPQQTVTNISMETVGGRHRVVLQVDTLDEMYELSKVARSIFSATPHPADITLNQAQVEALKEVLRISDRDHEAWNTVKAALK